MLKKLKLLIVIVLVAIFISSAIPAIAAQTSKQDKMLDEIGKTIDEVNKDSDYVYIIGKYAFTSVLNVPDIMVAARSIEVAEDEDVYEKMAIHCLKRTYDENFKPTGWEVSKNLVGEEKLEIEKIDICYVDKVTVEEVKTDTLVTPQVSNQSSDNSSSKEETTIPNEEPKDTPNEEPKDTPNEEPKDTPNEEQTTTPAENQTQDSNGVDEVEQTEHTHNFTDWNVTVEPTCLTPGVKTRRCQTCNEEETEAIVNPHAHKVYRAEDLDREPTCTKIGMEDCYRCEICGQEFFKLIKELGHDFKNEVIDKVATCTEDGYKSVHCTRDGCNEKTDIEKIPALGHKYDQKEEIKLSCTTDEKTVETCSTCGNKKETIKQKATGHNFDNYKYNNDATCLKNGTETGKCTKCGAESTREVPNSKVIHHNYETISKEEATCTKEGKLVQRCTICQQEKTTIIPKAAHDWKTEEYATEKYECLGNKVKRTCENCEEEEIIGGDFIYGTGHKWVLDAETQTYYCETCKFKQPTDDTRAVWFISYEADTSASYGFESGSLKIKGIISDYKYVQKAPDARPGYKFVGWEDAKTGEKIQDEVLDGGTQRLSDDGKTITITWRDMHKTFRACYEKVD